MMPKSYRRISRLRSPAARTGFSMLEMLVVVIILGILVAIAVPKMAMIMRHERVNRAAQVLTQDLQNGFAMAGRQRLPVRLTFYPTELKYIFTNRATGQVLQQRLLGKGTEFSITSLASNYAIVDVMPNGIGSQSFVVTVSNGDYSRQVKASSAGFVRMSPQ
jgi:prepilin-type N-terminal cleavage/methylation domain-containing protein